MVVAFDATGVLAEAVIAEAEFVPDLRVIRVAVGAEFEGGDGFGEAIGA